VIAAEWDRLPLDPVTVTGKVPADENVHESVELPEPVRLVGISVHAVLLVDRLSRPVKPFRAVTVTVEAAAVPALTVMLTGLALML